MHWGQTRNHSFHVPEVTTYEGGRDGPRTTSSASQGPLVGEPAAEWFKQGLKQRTGTLTGTGELIGSLLLSQVFTHHGQILQVKPSTALQRDDFKRANVIILGGPRQNPIFRELQAGLNFIYPAQEAGCVLNVRPAPGEAARYKSDLDSSGTGVDYAVVSKLNDPVSGYLILLFGANTGISVEAGVRYFTNPSHVKFLLERLRTGSSGLPDSYQVLLEVSSRNAGPEDVHYVTHRAIPSE
ncbi:MAG: hypothetical protein ACE15E_10105 [Acidobacteriota bacterium]